jgi:manganese transport protein
VIGAFFAIGDATIDSAFSCAYNLAQHQGWPWGKKNGLAHAKLWTAVLLGAYGIGYAIIQTRVDPSPQQWPCHSRSGRSCAPRRTAPSWDDTSVASWPPLAWLSFAVICMIAIAGSVLMVLTHMGDLE